MRTKKTKKKVKHIYFSTLGIRIDHNVYESIIRSYNDIRLIRTIKLVFDASLLRMQHQGVRAKTDWLGIRIMCREWSNVYPCTVVSVS
jgi:hypothetical protein